MAKCLYCGALIIYKKTKTKTKKYCNGLCNKRYQRLKAARQNDTSV
jgi:hypothetical protein